MILRNYLDSITAKLSGGLQSDDRALHPKLIYYTLLSLRSKLMSQKLTKRQKISDWSYQTVDCINMIEVPINTCPCLPASGCTVLRSENKIPKPLSGLSYMAIQGVFSVDMSRKFQYVTRMSYTRAKGNKYTGGNKQDRFMIMNDYLYLYGDSLPLYLVMKGIFENPVEVSNFSKNCSDEVSLVDCSGPLDINFPIEPDLEDTLLEMTYNRIRAEFNYPNKDTVADNAEEDSTTNTSTSKK